MKVTRILATSFLVAAGLFVAGNAHAQGALRLSWNSCSYVQNQDYSTPTLYKLVISLMGENRQMRGSRVKVSIGPNVPNAWRFDELGPGCNAGVGQVTVSNAAFSKTCPVAIGSGALQINQYLYDDLTGKALLDVAVTHAPRLDLIPATRYTLSQITFNHQFSVAGPEDPAVACGDADRGQCFHITESEILLADFTKQTFVLENDFVTWDDAGNNTGCPGATQAEQSTWGRVKGLYR